MSKENTFTWESIFLLMGWKIIFSTTTFYGGRDGVVSYAYA